MSALKRLIVIAICIVSAAFVLTACNEEAHTHSLSDAVKENFVDSTCTETGSYDEVVYCSICSEEISRVKKAVEKKPHNHSQKAMSSEYLKTEATCTDSAVYYYSCSCGDKGTEVFESGEAFGHAYGEWVSNNDGTHTKTCANDNTHSGNINGNGNLVLKV